MDDGCSKRFDIGTLDLRTEGSYDGLNAGTRPVGGSMGHLMPPVSGLPPLAIPPVGTAGLLAPPPLRSRDLMGNDAAQGHPWGR